MKLENYGRIVTLGVATLATIGVIWALNVAQSILVPIVMGVLIAFLMNAISLGLARIPYYEKFVPKGLRIGLTAIVLFVILLGGVAFFARNLDPVVRALPQYLDGFSQIVADIAGRFDVDFELTWQSLDRLVLDNIDIQSAVRYTLNSLSVAAGYMVIVFLYAIFCLMEKDSLRTKLAAIFPDEEDHANVWRTIEMISSQIGTYFTAKTTLNVVLGVICYVIFLVFGIEHAAFFAVLTGIFNYIPYVGSWIAVALPMLFALGQFGLSGTVLAVLACLAGAQMVVGYFWEPRLLGRSLNLSPVVILLSLAGWTAIWGLPGAIMSVILTSAIMTILAQFPASRPLAIMMTNTGEVPLATKSNPETTPPSDPSAS